MRQEYLIAGVILIFLGGIQVWFNGLWPFKKPHSMPAHSAASAWGSWTRVVGYVSLVVGLVVVVVAFFIA